MARLKTTATVRMYNVGFGDAFLVTVKRGATVWRMLVDCGVFPAGQTRPIRESVAMIIDDLAAEAPEGSPPHLDVVVATHHHVDHISGFADPAWEKVQVDDVWVPYVEDRSDPDAIALRTAQSESARALDALISKATQRLAAADEKAREQLAVASIFAANSRGDDVAGDRLLGRNGRTFLGAPQPRYLPDVNPAKNVISTPIEGVKAHVLGPSRDPRDVKRMDPPKSVRWLQLAEDERPLNADATPLFDPSYAVSSADVDVEVPQGTRSIVDGLELQDAGLAAELLAAASILENSVNNTSIFFVLDVHGTRLVFVGDSQHGAWEHVLNDAESLELVKEPRFYKIGHHGSHNATPKRYAEELLGREGYAMMPFGPVTQWPSIPENKLLTALAAKHTHVIRADERPLPADSVICDDEDRWSEVRFEVIPRAATKPEG